MEKPDEQFKVKVDTLVVGGTFYRRGEIITDPRSLRMLRRLKNLGLVRAVSEDPEIVHDGKSPEVEQEMGRAQGY